MKVLFVNSEIFPYLPETPIANIGRYLPQGIQERKKEIRSFMPRYGCINERKNQLHEVIRLSGMNIIINDVDRPLVIKVASISAARIQVYFIDNEDYFKRKQLSCDDNGAFFGDNAERAIFFARGVLETVKKLRWIPDVIHCSGWITALAPLYIKDYYGDDPTYTNTKVVYSLFDDDFQTPFDARLAEKLKFDGLKEDNFKELEGKQADYLELTKLAIAHSDGIVQCSANVGPEVLELVKKSGKPFLPFQEGDEYVTAYTDFYNKL